ncbi:hypothetical protein M8J75_003195 [Diaphorina citri]|nr:hypothetical protein M8J75_003195 [Diaphorina citri]KAI5731890.1 hypothetical protein M8J77_017932 [Diaphorina citri]
MTDVSREIFCENCSKVVAKPYYTSCGHTFCYECLYESTALNCLKCDAAFPDISTDVMFPDISTSDYSIQIDTVVHEEQVPNRFDPIPFKRPIKFICDSCWKPLQQVRYTSSCGHTFCCQCYREHNKYACAKCSFVLPVLSSSDFTVQFDVDLSKEQYEVLQVPGSSLGFKKAIDPLVRTRLLQCDQCHKLQLEKSNYISWCTHALCWECAFKDNGFACPQCSVVLPAKNAVDMNISDVNMSIPDINMSTLDVNMSTSDINMSTSVINMSTEDIDTSMWHSYNMSTEDIDTSKMDYSAMSTEDINTSNIPNIITFPDQVYTQVNIEEFEQIPSYVTIEETDPNQESATCVFSVLNDASKPLERADRVYYCDKCCILLEQLYYTLGCGHTFCLFCMYQNTERECPKCDFVLPERHLLGFPQESSTAEQTDLHEEDDPLNIMRPDQFIYLIESSQEIVSLIPTEDSEEPPIAIRHMQRQLVDAETGIAEKIFLSEYLKQLLSRKLDQEPTNDEEITVVTLEKNFVDYTIREEDERREQLADLLEEDAISSDMNIPSLENLQYLLDTHSDNLEEKFYGYKGKAFRSMQVFKEDLLMASKYRNVRCIGTYNFAPVNMDNNHSTFPCSIAFNKSNTDLSISGTDNCINLFKYNIDVESDVPSLLSRPYLVAKHNDHVSCTSWNQFHENILAYSTLGGVVFVWDLEHSVNKFFTWFRENNIPCRSVAFSPFDPNVFCSSFDDGTIKFWDQRSKKMIGAYKLESKITEVNFNPWLPYNLLFTTENVVMRCDLRYPLNTLTCFKGHTSSVESVKLVSKYENISSAIGNEVMLWNIHSKGKPLLTYRVDACENNTHAVTIATNGDLVAIGSVNNYLKIFHKKLSRHLFSYTFYAPNAAEDHISALCFHPQRQELVAADNRGIIKIIRLEEKSISKVERRRRGNVINYST